MTEAERLWGAELKHQIEKVIIKTDFSPRSKGYRQRVGIAQAPLRKPKVNILDEPTIGLDSIQIIEIHDLILGLVQTHTVIFSSHILSEMQVICERIMMIVKSKLAAQGAPEDLQKQL